MGEVDIEAELRKWKQDMEPEAQPAVEPPAEARSDGSPASSASQGDAGQELVPAGTKRPSVRQKAAVPETVVFEPLAADDSPAVSVPPELTVPPEQGKDSGRIARFVVVVMIGILCAVIAFSHLQPLFSKGAPQGGKGGAAQGRGGALPDGADTVTVSVHETRLEVIESTVRLNGNISSRSQVSLFPDTSGKLVRFVKEAGDSVRRGEIVAYVDPSRPGAFYQISPVLSTISGTLISRGVSAGDTVSTGSVIATVGSLTDLEIKVDVAEKYAASLHTGLHAYVSLISVPDENFDAVVTRVSPVVDAAKRTIEVTLAFSRQDDRIRPGMFGTVRLAVARSEDTVVVPRSALTTYNAEPVVYIVDSAMRARRRGVTVGLTNDESAEITGGLIAGDTVITAGSVTEGTAVRVAGGRQ